MENEMAWRTGPTIEFRSAGWSPDRAVLMGLANFSTCSNLLNVAKLMVHMKRKPLSQKIEVVPT